MLVIDQYKYPVITENNNSPKPRWVLNTHAALCRGETAAAMSLQILAGRVTDAHHSAHSPVK